MNPTVAAGPLRFRRLGNDLDDRGGIHLLVGLLVVTNPTRLVIPCRLFLPRDPFGDAASYLVF